MNLKLIGILVGVFGAGLFGWHLVKVTANEKTSQGFGSHHLLSLIGGILIIVGIGIYIFGRKRLRKHLNKD